MITPSQIKEKVLSTASHGYDIDETNAFLQQIEESFTAIYDENKELYRKMEILASKIEEYRAEEDSIKDTLLTAQKAASKVEKEAKEKSEKLLADSAQTVQNTVLDAKEKAEKIVSEAREYAAQITKEKTDAAQSIISEAQEKAEKELNDAKADAAALLTEAKSISQELLSKSKEEKEYYDHLTDTLKSEAQSFKDRLVSLYETQLEKLGEMMESPVQSDNNEFESKVDEAEKSIESVSAKIEEMEQDMQEEEKETEISENEERSEESAEEIAGTTEEEPDAEEESGSNADDVEYELEEISDDDPAEETDVEDAIDAFSQDSDEQENAAGVPEINEEPEMELPHSKEVHEQQEEEHLPFEDFFHIKPEGVRTDEKISLIPPDDDDDEDDGVKFKGFFRKKRK
ncbi:MAG TPA: DivIVA domain-containing protein [Candidatus Eubacterium faecavium]|nr:DivIVA domain-containing protein [Candidatus Eubacterium faecavium]